MNTKLLAESAAEGVRGGPVFTLPPPHAAHVRTSMAVAAAVNHLGCRKRETRIPSIVNMMNAISHSASPVKLKWNEIGQRGLRAGAGGKP